MYRKPLKGPGVLHCELQHGISTTEQSIHHTLTGFESTEAEWRLLSVHASTSKPPRLGLKHVLTSLVYISGHHLWSRCSFTRPDLRRRSVSHQRSTRRCSGTNLHCLMSAMSIANQNNFFLSTVRKIAPSVQLFFCNINWKSLSAILLIVLVPSAKPRAPKYFPEDQYHNAKLLKVLTL